MKDRIYLIYEIEYGDSYLIGYVNDEISAVKVVECISSKSDNDGAYYEEVDSFDRIYISDIDVMSDKDFKETQCKMVEGIFNMVSEELISYTEYHYQKKEPWQKNLIEPVNHNNNVLMDRVVMFMDCEQLKNREEVITEYYKTERKKMLEKRN